MHEILLVDDERSIRNSMRAMLESEGFAVRTARSGDEAVRMFQEKRPDVVLLDVMMPGKGGIQTCSELRGIDKLAPILFLTAVPSDTTKVRAFGAGADDYIEKTCNPDVLVARIRAALRRSEAVSDATSGASRVRLGSVVVDMALLRVTDDAGLDELLTRTEAALFAALNQRRGKYVSSDELFSAIHGEDFAGSPANIRKTVSKLKHKLGRARDMIVNNPNAGYRLLA